MEELAPFGRRVGVLGCGCVDELEDEGAAGDDALASGEEVASDDAMKGRISR